MRLEAATFVIVTIFFALVTPLYWWASGDPTGTTALTLTFGLGAMISFYLMMLARRIPDRPEDRQNGEIAELAGEYGFFSPHSWYPLMVAASGAFVVIGLVFAWFIVIIGMALMAITTVGMYTEYYRGEHAH